MRCGSVCVCVRFTILECSRTHSTAQPLWDALSLLPLHNRDAKRRYHYSYTFCLICAVASRAECVGGWLWVVWFAHTVFGGNVGDLLLYEQLS